MNLKPYVIPYTKINSNGLKTQFHDDQRDVPSISQKSNKQITAFQDKCPENSIGIQ